MGWVQLQEKLSHPYKLTHEKLQIKMEGFFFFFCFFCDGFPKGRKEKKKFRISRDFSRIFALFSLYFSIFLSIFFFLGYFYPKKMGIIYRRAKKVRGYVLCVMTHNTQSPTFASSSSYFFFLISGPMIVQLFGGIFKLRFLQTLYPWKDLDVQLPLVLTLQNLELRLLRYRIRKEGDAMLKIL